MTDELRFGRPPEMSDRPQAPRRAPGWLVVAVAAVLLVAAAVAGVTYFVGLDVGRARASSSTPTPFVVASADIGEEAACVLLFPSFTDAVEQIQALADQPNGSTVKWDKIEKIIANLEGARALVPPDMRAEVDALLKPLRQLDDIYNGRTASAPLELEGFRNAGRQFGARCVKYGR